MPAVTETAMLAVGEYGNYNRNQIGPVVCAPSCVGPVGRRECSSIPQTNAGESDRPDEPWRRSGAREPQLFVVTFHRFGAVADEALSSVLRVFGFMTIR
jgi:hypothetical protein